MTSRVFAAGAVPIPTWADILRRFMDVRFPVKTWRDPNEVSGDPIAFPVIFELKSAKGPRAVKF